MKLKQQSRLSQQLALTPRLQQAIRLLQFSAADLNLEIEKALENNPFLERTDSLSGSDLRPADEINTPDTFSTTHALSTEENAFPAETDVPGNETDFSPFSDDISFDFQNQSSPVSPPDDTRFMLQAEAPPLSLREYLTSQVHLVLSDRRQLALAELIIDALDENGYLGETLDEMLEWLPEELAVRMPELESALQHVQALEPAGIAARNSTECLAIQLKRLPGLPYVTRKRALAIVENHLELLAKRDFARLKKYLDCDDEDLAEAQKVIHACSPYPGAPFLAREAHTLIPELLVFFREKQWQAALNPAALPKIRINAMYADVMKKTQDRHLIKPRLQEANWFIRNLRQRFDTILKTGQAIVKRQQAFFSDGAISMNPLVLHEIADTLELHESTVSRVTNQKYMQTPHGIFELKYFFGSHLTTESGSTVSSTAVRERIRQLIGEENRKKPLSDNRITQILEEQGLVIARRTVAKYRKALKIPPAHMRKSLSL